jgi:L-alanine-DL-glutamate epimerase-like enolase superfamily enzyme
MSNQAARPDEADSSSEITSIECFPLRLPLRKPLVMSTYRLDDGPVLYVRIRARCGAEGWGEAAASPIMAGETLSGMVACVRELIEPHLIGRPALDRAAFVHKLKSTIYGNGGAIAAVDMALLDLAGKLKGVAVADLLGGAVRRTITPLWLIGGSGRAHADVAEAQALHEQGFRAFKLKVGVSSVDNEIGIVAELRRALDADCLIAADANMGWSVSTARHFARMTASYRLAFLEQPVPFGDIPRMAAVAAQSPVPIGADETIHGLTDVLALHAAGAIGGLSLKTIKLGGITPLSKLAIVCDALGLSVNLAMMMESSLATAAMIHAGCVIPNLDWGLSLGNLWLADEPVVNRISCQNGLASCPSGPGLGIEIDERRIASFAA